MSEKGLDARASKTERSGDKRLQETTQLAEKEIVAIVYKAFVSCRYLIG